VLSPHSLIFPISPNHLSGFELKPGYTLPER
jgi:hypothetical protein